MITNYQERKKDVLSSCEKVETLVAALQNNATKIDMPDPLESVNSLLADIRSKADRVRKDQFRIMIVGESKSGKSTFINAYLGADLLPVSVKQCTSSIIEIKYGPEFMIRATYAGGKTKEITGEQDARDFLKANAALDDAYRDIPVPTINSEILVKSGKRAKKAGKQSVPFDMKVEVNNLLNAPEVQEANIHNLSATEYRNKILRYIEDRKDHWEEIVTKIEVRFPFKNEEMRGIEIVDSPGVCARGGVAEITSGYIENADAIIFLKPITGQALESTQFTRFMRSASVERNKEALFLVLTRAADVPAADALTTKEEAVRQFGTRLGSDHILLVDSKAELYAQEMENVDDIEAELRKLNEAGTLDKFVLYAYTSTSGLFGTGGKADFIDALRKLSGFSQVYNAMELFGRKAHYILLGDTLDSIDKLYSKLWNNVNLQMDMFCQKAEDPSELAKKIGIIKTELSILQNKMYKGVGDIAQRFQGDDGIIKKKADEAVEDFKRRAAEIDSNSDDAFNDLESLSFTKIDDFKKLTQDLQAQFVAACDKELIALSEESKIPYNVLQPEFTEQTFEEARESTKEKANEKKSYEDGVTFKKTHSYSVYSQNKHFKILKDNIEGRLDGIKNDLMEYVLSYIDQIRAKYIEELRINAKAKENELDTIMKAKADSERIAEIVADLNRLATQIKEAKAEAIKIGGGIRKNVQ